MTQFLDKAGLTTLWQKVKTEVTTGDSELQNQITNIANKFGAKNGLATLDSDGNVPLEQLGNLDTTVFQVCTTLPTSNINSNLIYVVPGTSSSTQNMYDEYIYISSKSSWEKLGSTKSDTDLSDYYTKAEANALVGKRLSTISVSETTSNVTLGCINDSGTTNVTIPSATSTTAGVMSSADKAKLDQFDPSGTIAVDTEISTTSENPVQNKVVTAYINSKASDENVTTEVQSTTSAGPFYVTFIGTSAKTTSHLKKCTNLSYVPSTNTMKCSISGTAAKATADANGNTINTYYATTTDLADTKNELSASIEDLNNSVWFTENLVALTTDEINNILT